MLVLAACSGGEHGDTPTPSSTSASSTSVPATGSSASPSPPPTAAPTTAPDQAAGAARAACRERRRAVRAQLPDIDHPGLTDVAQVISDDEAAGCAALCGPLLASLGAEDPCPDAGGPGAP